MKKIKTSGSQKLKTQMKIDRKERSESYDYKWRQFAINYKKNNPFCVECLKDGKYVYENIHVDHIIPLELAPERKYDLTNLQSLCISCHGKKTHKEKLD